MSGCKIDVRSRLNQTRKEEREYSKLICSFMRSLDEHQRKQDDIDKRERALSEAESVRTQLQTDLIAGADGMGRAHESADSIQELESNANDSYLVRKIESDSKARERYKQAISKLNKQKMDDINLKNTKRTQLPTPKFSQESTFNAIAKAIETKKHQKREFDPCLKSKPITGSTVKKYSLSYINVYSAPNKHKVEKSDKKNETKAADLAVVKNAETKRKEAEHAMRREEQLERARLRGKHADHINRMEKDRQEILRELSFYQKKEMQQKRTKLEANIPLDPPYPEKKAIERRKQRELESQFEKLFIPSQDHTVKPTEQSQESAYNSQTKLRDLISQQKFVFNEMNEMTDDNLMTSLPDSSSQSLSVYALSTDASL
ncbi:hypothetical protein LOD99_11705 [Oopsacas minuta]|uniref:Uncharacterized protein n=1 Tax=Oopsacas minuta TaxID=111878 RepID=A0AAV7JLG2_9METZ|nr:hypothetical protein LOD99_11705 [Oopsacas minuta]